MGAGALSTSCRWMTHPDVWPLSGILVSPRIACLLLPSPGRWGIPQLCVPYAMVIAEWLIHSGPKHIWKQSKVLNIELTSFGTKRVFHTWGFRLIQRTEDTSQTESYLLVMRYIYEIGCTISLMSWRFSLLISLHISKLTWHWEKRLYLLSKMLKVKWVYFW